jgi:Ca2+-binding EF-hand superfamily protein
VTINGTYSQSVSLTFAFTSYPPSASLKTPDTTIPAVPPATDSVNLSPQATIASSVTGAPGTSSDASRRGTALFTALDADRDGSVTRQEFSQGAARLLREAGARLQQVSADGADGDPQAAGVPPALGSLLDRAFTRVDANRDGTVNRTELTSALEQAAARLPVQSATADNPSPSSTAVAAPAVSTPSTQPSPTPDSIAVSVSVSQQTTVSFSSVDQSTPPSSASPRADALFGALDADHDGSITKSEFTEGAAALLRQRRTHRHHHRDDDGTRVQHESHVPPGLEKRLGRVFAEVDANHNGSVDRGELTGALTTSPTSPSPTPAAGQFQTLSVTQVTTVSFAVQRYVAVDQSSGTGTPGSLNAAA